jgi:hypothetical protein
LFSFSAQNTTLHALLAFKIPVEKSEVILMSLPLHVICFFSLTTFNILSLFSVFVVLMMICQGQFYFGQVSLGSWRLPVPEWA